MTKLKKVFCFLAIFILFMDFHVLAQEDIKAVFLDEVNKLRQSGCKCGDEFMPPVPALTWNNKLETAAIIHVKDMFENKNFNHVGTDGSILSERIEEAGYKWSMIGENISYGYTNPLDAIQGWVDSEGHCHNMMSEVFMEMGAANKGSYWVLDLGVGK